MLCRALEKAGHNVAPVLRASLLAADGKPREADAALAKAAGPEAALARAQLAAASGDAAAALQLLEQVRPLSTPFRPASREAGLDAPRGGKLRGLQHSPPAQHCSAL